MTTKYVKVINLMNGNDADYKGLDINKVVPGSPIYPDTNTAYLIIEQEIPNNEDLIEITEQEYSQARVDYERQQDQAFKNSDTAKIAALEEIIENAILEGKL